MDSASNEASSEQHCRLYLITRPVVPDFRFAGTAEALAAALDAGDVACVRLALCTHDEDIVTRAAKALMPECHSRGVAFILTNSINVACAIGADGVHLSDSFGVGLARRTLGADAIIGVCCGFSRHAALVAAEAGADYVAFGPAFTANRGTEVRTREKRSEAASPDVLKAIAWWHEITVVPCVAFGGIRAENLEALATAGADFLAVGSALWAEADGVPNAEASAVARNMSGLNAAVARARLNC